MEFEVMDVELLHQKQTNEREIKKKKNPKFQFTYRLTTKYCDPTIQ